MKKKYVTKSLVCNPDGTVTYWSASRENWICHSSYIPDVDLGAMCPNDRRQALIHLYKSHEESTYSAV